MKPDIRINEISISDLGWLRETVHFPTPKSQSNTIVVPGRNSPIRYTGALGRVSYQPRTFQMSFSMYGSRATFNQMVSEVSNRFSGKLSKVVTSEEPNLYLVGTLEVTPSFDSYAKKGMVEISCEDGDVYKYHINETVVVVNGDGIALLNNDYMPVIPSITTTAETSLNWTVGTDEFTKTVSAGTWVFPEMELIYGENTINIIGSGITTFRYREGCL